MARKKVLVIDDSQDIRTVYCTMLEWRGFEVMQASNGAEGVELARRFRPDVIVTDINMPVMDGWTSAEILKGSPDTWDIPIIAVTCFRFRDVDQRTHRDLFCAMFEKPISPELVARAVEDYSRAAPVPG